MSKKYTDEDKRKYLDLIKTKCSGNVTEASKLFSISKKTLCVWMKQLGEKTVTDEVPVDSISFDDLEMAILTRIKDTIPLMKDAKKLAETYKLIKEIAQMGQDANRKDKVYDEMMDFLNSNKIEKK